MALRFPSTPASKLPKPPPGQHPREAMARACLESTFSPSTSLSTRRGKTSYLLSVCLTHLFAQEMTSTFRRVSALLVPTLQVWALP